MYNYCPPNSIHEAKQYVSFHINTVSLFATSRDVIITRSNQMQSIKCNLQILLQAKCSQVCYILMKELNWRTNNTGSC